MIKVVVVEKKNMKDMRKLKGTWYVEWEQEKSNAVSPNESNAPQLLLLVGLGLSR